MAARGERRRTRPLEEATISLIARLYDQHPVAPQEGSALRRHVDAQRAYCAWLVEGLSRSPLIESPSNGSRRMAFLRRDAFEQRYREVHFGDVQVPGDPDSLILHHAAALAA